jgi:polyvinyl alcohol dehydrogenase (cytochrome)
MRFPSGGLTMGSTLFVSSFCTVIRGRKSFAAVGALFSMLVTVAIHLTPAAAQTPDDWPMFGQNLQNTAAIGANSGKDVKQLKTKWTFTTGGDVSARAAVVRSVVYFPDWGGNLWAINATTGKQVWGHQLSDYSLTGSFNGIYHSRTSPAVMDGVVYVGTQEGAWLLAINATTGELKWKTQLESPAHDPFALITASPVVYHGVVYTGVASNQEGAAAFVPGFICCNARGSVVAINAASGAVIWQTYTVPTGYSGGGVWSSNFVVDPGRGTVFVGTGNNYSHPTDPNYLGCISAGGTAAVCSSKDNHVDSILALDMNTGAIKWAHKAATWKQLGVTDGSDDWNVSCAVSPFTNCPSNAGPDYDFASAPNLITYHGNRGKKTILGAGQKSGIYYALDPDTGAELWHRQVGPGSSLGGMEWGSASDGERVYVAIANFYGIPSPVGSAGSVAALDPETGAILWQVADPNGSISLGPLAVADGVVYASSMASSATAPTMLALNATNGKLLWSFAAGSSVNAGATIVHDVVYWGSGYAHLGIPGFTGNNKFYAFSQNEKEK